MSNNDPQNPTTPGEQRPAEDPAEDALKGAFGVAKQQVPTQFGFVPKPTNPVGERPYRALGHDRGRFFFWTRAGRQVLGLRARDLHSPAELPQLAPIQWLEREFPGGRESFSTKLAGDTLMRECFAQGIYDPNNVRGRGVWLDQGRAIIHLGGRLLVDGAEVPLVDFESPHIYEQAAPMVIGLGEAMSDDEARGFVRLCCEVAWESPDRDGRMLAGWLVSALLCGGMAWRTHIWLVSEAGAGKTWVMDNLIKPVLRSLALMVQSKTSEAGIRGLLKSDARPVVFDEAETQSDGDRARMQAVLDLARQSSSDDGGDIAKGTQDGGARVFKIRSSFCFASINLGLSQSADESRFVVLRIGTGDPDQFDALKAAHRSVMTEGFAGRLLARCLRLLPTIRANAAVLARAISRTGAGQRAGDTLGTLMACTLSLTTSATLTDEQAAKMVADREWVVEAAREARPEPEWAKALARLMQAEAAAATGRQGYTVADLVEAATNDDPEQQSPTSQAAITWLKRMGLRIDQHYDSIEEVRRPVLWISRRSDAIDRIFAGSTWASAWADTLRRAPGSATKVIRYQAAVPPARSVGIPLSLLTDLPSDGWAHFSASNVGRSRLRLFCRQGDGPGRRRPAR